MSDLEDMTCSVCQVGAPAMPESEIEELVAQVPGWSVTEQQQIKRLERLFSFRNFADALDFTRRVGELAEAHGHHPRIVTEWGKVKVVWWTHKIRGLHLNDFMMAAKTDKLVG